MASLLEPHLGNYLKFHSANGRHLPENFKQGAQQLTLGKQTSDLLENVAFTSYSIFINLALAFAAAEECPDAVNDALDAYDRISRVVLRCGAAIDLAQQLEQKLHVGFDDKSGTVSIRKNGSCLYRQLKHSLKDIDGVNNFLKHNGLPAVRTDEQGLLAPSKLQLSATMWEKQHADTPIKTLLKSAVKRVLEAFNTYYDGLVTASAQMHTDLQLTLSESGFTIHDRRDGYSGSNVLSGSLGKMSK